MSEIELLRHALGLSNRSVSYRRAFVAGPGHVDHPAWLKMTDAGDAERRIAPAGYGGSDVFIVTRQGAERALRRGELLDLEDFPPLRSPANSTEEK